MQIKFIQLITLIKRLGIALLCFTILRALFWLFNHRYFPDVDFSVFILGLRFDLSALFYGYALFTVLHVLPFSFVYTKGYQKALFWIFMIFHTIYMSWNIIDFEYYKFIFRRSTADVFLFFRADQDGWTMLPRFLLDYGYLFLVLVAMLIVTVFLYKKTITKHTHNRLNYSFVYSMLQFVILVALTIFFGRGGWQLRPIGLVDAGHFTKASNVPVVLNTPFSIITSMFQSDEVKLKQYMSEVEALSFYTIDRKIIPVDSLSKKNVVIIILESFGKEYSFDPTAQTKSYTPFLDSLTKVSTVFESGFANSKRSIDAVPAILAGLPCLSENPFIYSRYASTPIRSLPTTLAHYDYHSSFFHGGKNGTMGFEAFCSLVGVDQYYGKDEYKGSEEDFDGHWGIFDEPYLQFVANKIGSFEQPFLSTIFTLSSHHPYLVPKQYKDVFDKGSLPIHESIRYADHALKMFFKTATQSDWYDNTLFVITADHTAQAEHPYYAKGRGMFAIPVLFFDPNAEKRKINSPMQHVDFFPTILSYLGIEDQNHFFGYNRLDSLQAIEPIMTYNYGIFQIEQDGYFLQQNGNHSLGLFHVATDSLLNTNLLDQKTEVSLMLENKLKAYIQTYKQTMDKGILAIQR